jgi:hypothetical protein
LKPLRRAGVAALAALPHQSAPLRARHSRYVLGHGTFPGCCVFANPTSLGGFRVFNSDPESRTLIYIDFYNMRRLHSTNVYKTPIDHERLDKPEAAA